ncbi:MAG: 30S ribosomal protein S9 [Sphingobacteriales bacterium]|nr:MAG: 30S ribosomal protein S9 [Sphingobacteriales bacterium]GDX53068.1 30S ribosomal protein S9 [Bacteroidota bacterium]
MEKTIALGRRKEATARVNIVSGGTGKITINGVEYKKYFPQAIYQQLLEQPFMLLNIVGQYDVEANTAGGGVKGQSEAIRLGISRGLLKINPEYRTVLKPNGLLTRDPRSVERKKPGKKKARKSFQFSKR